MDRRTVGSALVVLASLAAALAVALLVVALTEPEQSNAPSALPHGIDLPIPPVVAAGERAVSPTVLATADLAVAASAPGLALEKVELAGSWEESRAVIRDLTTHDVRAYAIGDLLPHGSLLVGLSADSADIMVADVELVRLSVGGKPRLVYDLRVEREALQRAPDHDRAYRAAIEDSIRVLGSASAETVQAHLDELLECGDPAVEILIHHVDDRSPIAPGPYQLPAGSDFISEPNVVGDAVIAVLESITGQTFGDPTGASDEERAEIARAWQRWWGLP